MKYVKSQHPQLKINDRLVHVWPEEYKINIITHLLTYSCAQYGHNRIDSKGTKTICQNNVCLHSVPYNSDLAGVIYCRIWVRHYCEQELLPTKRLLVVPTLSLRSPATKHAAHHGTTKKACK